MVRQASGVTPVETHMNEEKQQERQPCEVYSRVVGYLRPVNQWNDGKRNEFEDRQHYQVKGE